MRKLILAVYLFVASIATAGAELAVSIGINVPAYPQLVLVPGYPVYYAPRLNANYFFYDGAYWVFEGDNWYVSSWYNGPWELVAPEAVPVYILRVPVRYYHRRPAYFYGWRADAPPHWGEHWGAAWAQTRVGWDRWNYASVPAAAPLPIYQRQYSGTRYPSTDQQYAIQARYYHYQPRDAVVRQHVVALRMHEAPTTAPRPTSQAAGSPTARLRAEHARSIPATTSRTPERTVAANRGAAPQTHGISVAAAHQSRPAPEQRNIARHESTVAERAPRPMPEHRDTAQRRSQPVSVAQSRGPKVQRAQPVQRDAGERSRHVTASAPRAPAIQPQHPQAQRAAGPRMAEPKKDREKGQG